MANKTLINVHLPASSTPSNGELGATVEIGTGGQPPSTAQTSVELFPGGRAKYVKTSGVITAGMALAIDTDAISAERSYTVRAAVGAGDRIEGVALVDAAVGQYLYMAMEGVVSGVQTTGSISPTLGIRATATPGQIGAYDESAGATPSTVISICAMVIESPSASRSTIRII